MDLPTGTLEELNPNHNPKELPVGKSIIAPVVKGTEKTDEDGNSN